MSEIRRIWEFEGGLEVGLVKDSLLLGSENFSDLPHEEHGYTENQLQDLCKAARKRHSHNKQNSLFGTEPRPLPVSGSTEVQIVIDCIDLYSQTGERPEERLFALGMLEEINDTEIANRPRFVN